MEKLKILLVDDSEVVARHVVGLLDQKGYVVRYATTIPAALELFARHQPQAILVDFVLEAGQTGLQMLQAIFAVAESQNMKKPTAALLTMAHLSPEDEAQAKALQTRVLQKPRRGKEADFLQEVSFWLRDAGLE